MKSSLRSALLLAVVVIARPLLADEPKLTAAQQAQLDEATKLNQQGMNLDDEAKYAQAEDAYQRALSIRETILGPDDPKVAYVLNNLASLYDNEGKYAQAEPLHQRAIAIGEKTLGPDHPDLASLLGCLALLYEAQGKYAQSEPLYERALKIDEKSLGPDHPTVAIRLNSLAVLYGDQGKYAQAELLFQRALKIDEKAQPDHPSLARHLNNLAQLYRTQGKYAQAEPLYERALKILETALGPDHPDLATCLNNLALLYYDQGKYPQAEPLQQRALKIDEKARPDHPSLAIDLNNLAQLYRTQGKYAQAEPLYERALKILETALGPDHPMVATAYCNVSVMQAAQAQWPWAAKNEDQARRVVRHHVSRELPALSAKDQLTFLRATDEGPFHVALSLGLAQRTDEAISAKSDDWLVNGKAVAQEALTQNVRLGRDAADPHLAAKVQKLMQTRRQLAALLYTAPKAGEEAERRQQLEQMQAQEEDLGRQISRATGQKVGGDPWISLEALRTAIPADGVLIDIARFDVRNFAAKGTENKWLPAHCAAWLTLPAGKGDIHIVDLGEADKIDQAVQSVCKAMEQAMGGSSEKGSITNKGEGAAEILIQRPLADLAKLVWEPLSKAIPNETKEIILSPDASLWLIPWDALPTGYENGEIKYAIEKYNIRYVVSGRDLANQQVSSKLKPTQPVVMANPDYDLGPSQVETATRSVLRSTQVTSNDELRGLTAGNSASALPKVGRLPGTAKEAAAIKPKLASYAHQDAAMYLDQYATEGIFKALKRPQVLVMSTHGFFLPDQEVQRDRGGRMQSSDAQRSAPALTVDGKPIENPLLRCGLLLAGCNKSAQASNPGRDRQEADSADDGILTGMEIVGTDLRGTELVVLSACETGLGDVHNGEGVAGLRQAFQLAGAKAVVATLWQIPDKDSSQIMSQFFTNLAAGQSKSESLRNAQLAQIELHRQRYVAAHPFFWAAYTITGQ